MIFIINWLIASFLQGMFFFLIMVFFFYWFYIKELPVNRQASAKPQFEQYELNASLREMLDTSAQATPRLRRLPAILRAIATA